MNIIINSYFIQKYIRKHVKESSETMQEPGQSGRGSTGAGVVEVVVVVVGRGVVRGTLKNT